MDPTLIVQLEVVSGAKQGMLHVKPPVTIGRGREAQLTLALPLVSRLHCELYRQGDALFVRDLGSTNGTAVGGAKVTEPVELRDGDLLVVGSVTFRLRLGVSAPTLSGLADQTLLVDGQVAEAAPVSDPDLFPPGAAPATPAAESEATEPQPMEPLVPSESSSVALAAWNEDAESPPEADVRPASVPAAQPVPAANTPPEESVSAPDPSPTASPVPEGAAPAVPMARPITPPQDLATPPQDPAQAPPADSQPTSSDDDLDDFLKRFSK